MIRLNTFLKVDEKDRQRVLSLGKQLVEKSRQDEGCISYDFFESTTISGVFMFCETWKDQASLDKHSNAQHFLHLVPEIESFGKMKLEKFSF